jgi:hypothetical protein
MPTPPPSSQQPTPGPPAPLQPPPPLPPLPPRPPLPTFNASAAAALLSLHPFVHADAAFLDALLSPCNGLARHIAALKRSAQRVTLAELVRSEPALQPRAFLASATAAAAAGAAAEAAAPGAGPAAEAASLAAAAAAAAAAVGALAAARPAVAAHAAEVLAAARAELSMARGVVHEGAALDRAEGALGARVAQRNAHLHRACFGGQYWLQGRLDGVVGGGGGGGSEGKGGSGGGGGAGADAGASAGGGSSSSSCSSSSSSSSPIKVVETKVRRKTLAATSARLPPEYDILQVRCYLAILRAGGQDVSEGLLVESFACGAQRTFCVVHSEALWATIHAGLCAVAQRFQALQPAELQALVAAFTVEEDGQE